MDIAEQILRANSLRASGLGLRFDRVALSLLADLRAFAEAEAPAGVSVLATVTAPIRLPARTVAELKREIGELLSAGSPREDWCGVVHGNAIRLRPLAIEADLKFVGFVHNPSSPSAALLDLAERWLREQA